jgi:hypothetical protein
MRYRAKNLFLLYLFEQSTRQHQCNRDGRHNALSNHVYGGIGIGAGVEMVTLPRVLYLPDAMTICAIRRAAFENFIQSGDCLFHDQKFFWLAVLRQATFVLNPKELLRGQGSKKINP